MLAVISDLHFQHTALDVVRFRDGGAVHELGVHRNVGPTALERFFSIVDERARRRRARSIHLVLAGDIFELHRTPLWFDGAHQDVRPYGELGPDDPGNPLRALVHRVLDAIEERNAAAWQVLARFVEGHAPAVHVHFIPGNHDRLLDGWPSVRRRVRSLLGMAPDDAPFPTTLAWPNGASTDDYGVRVRHGHELDRLNFACAVTEGRALSTGAERTGQPCFGDYVTIDVATRLAVAFRVRYAARLRDPGEDGRHLRSLYAALTEFDDVRPQTELVAYLTRQLGSDEEHVVRLLRPILRDALEAAERSAFFRDEARRLGFSGSFVLPLVRQAVKALSSSTLGSLVDHLLPRLPDHHRASPAEIARYEPGLGDTIDLVVAGHTHFPDQVAVAVPGADATAYFVDTGTWRTTITSGVGAFGRLRAFTMLFVYDSLERASGDADRRRFETWTGHLGSGATGTYEERRARNERVEQRVRLIDLVVDQAEPGRHADQAPVSAGVDGAAVSRRVARVATGERLELGVELAVDPALDGELWLHGWEPDPEDDPIRTDPLPWATGRLPRTAQGRFQPGPGNLAAAGSGGTRLTLRYEVLPDPP